MGAEKHEERVACLFRINTVLTLKAASFECVLFLLPDASAFISSSFISLLSHSLRTRNCSPLHRFAA